MACGCVAGKLERVWAARWSVTALLVIPVSWAVAQSTPVPTAAPTAKPAEVVQNTAPNAITMAAVQKGALRCASRAQQVTSYVGVTRGAYLMFSPGSADSQLFALGMAVELPGNSEAYVAASFAPGQANGCGAAIDSVVYWPDTCPNVRRQQFASLRETPRFGQQTQMLNGGDYLKVFLMNAGTGCISIKKEIVL